MRTVSTKLDNEEFTKFQNMCNNDGMCASEELRDMIKQHLEAHEEYLAMEKEKKESKDEPKPPHPEITIIDEPETPRAVSHGKILDNDGNVIGTF